MDINAFQKRLQQGEIITVSRSIWKLGCLSIPLFGMLFLCAVLFLVAGWVLVFHGTQVTAPSYEFFGLLRGLVCAPVISIFLIWVFFVRAPKALSVSKKGINLYANPADVRSNPHVFIPWHEILEIKSGTLEKKSSARSIACIVLKCTPDAVQTAQPLYKQVLDNLSKKQIPGEFSEVHIPDYSPLQISDPLSEGYQVMGDFIILITDKYLTLPPADILTLLQTMHKKARA